jgi:CheY-like chemotaxis protein
MANVLVIAASDSLRTMVRLSLACQRHRIEEACEGDDIEDKLRARRGCDLVIIDVPARSRAELNAVWDIHERCPSIKILVLTAAGDRAASEQAMIAGATDVLCKPFGVDMLRRSVQAALSRRTLRRRILDGLRLGSLMDRPDSPDWGDGLEPDGHGAWMLRCTTRNGFHVSYQSGAAIYADTETLYAFVVVTPDQGVRPCVVLMPSYIHALVKALTNLEEFPGGPRFWEAMAEEALTTYILVRSATPDDGVLRMDELTHGLRGWVRAVLTGRARTAQSPSFALK